MLVPDPRVSAEGSACRDPRSWRWVVSGKVGRELSSAGTSGTPMLGVEATLSPLPEDPIMSATQHRPRRRSARLVPVTHLGKPQGLLAPRVQAVGPEHFGIVAVDPAKARSYWMLADFYGRILIPA